MAFDLADWIASATASVKLAPVTNNKAITDTESEITTDVLFKGLNVTPTRIGFYDGSAWVSYFESTGYFFFKGDDRNYVSWDGSILRIEGIQASFGEAVYDADKMEYVYRNPIISGGRIKEASRDNVTTLSNDDIEISNTQNTNIEVFGRYYFSTSTMEIIKDSYDPSDNGLTAGLASYNGWKENGTNNYYSTTGYANYASGISKSVGISYFKPKTDIVSESPPIVINNFTTTTFNAGNRPTWGAIMGGLAVDGNGVLWFHNGTQWKIVTLI